MSSAGNVWTQYRRKPSFTYNEFPTLNDGSEFDNPGDPTIQDDSASLSQLQEDEVEVLRAIYMDDYEDIDSIAAWTRTKEHAFRIKLKSSSDENIWVYLHVKFSAHYPKTPPHLTLKHVEELREKTHSRLNELLQTKLEEHKSEVMIFDVCTSAQEILEDEVQQAIESEKIPSLKEERTFQEAISREEAKKKEELEKQTSKLNKAEEDRILKKKVDEELHRRKQNNRKSKNLSVSKPVTVIKVQLSKIAINQILGLQDSSITFDRSISVQLEGATVEFDTVTGFVEQGEGSITKVYTVTPTDGLNRIPILLALKQAMFQSKPNQYAEFRKTLLKFENDLDSVRKLQHGGLNGLVDFKVEKLPIEDIEYTESWRVSVLTEFANKGSLGDLLEISGTISLQKIRSWYIDLLEALEFLHRNGFIHGDIHVNNILMNRSQADGVISVQLADSVYQNNLRRMKVVNEKALTHSKQIPHGWKAPELIEDRSNSKSRKTDIWELGVVLIVMIFGSKVVESYDSPLGVVEGGKLSNPLEDIIQKLFHRHPGRRPSAFDLMPAEFLRTDVPVHRDVISSERSLPSASIASSRSPATLRHETSLNTNSRYAAEWIEAGRLGKGGYGEVWKARNKVDGRVYAIKKIVLNSSAMLTNTLSEVMLLSRLNHPYVVRYYTAWPEDELGQDSEPDGDSTDPSDDISRTNEISLSAFTQNTGLDFVSSSGYPKIDFNEDSEEDSLSGGEDDSNDSNLSNFGNSKIQNQYNTMPSKVMSHENKGVRQFKTVLYIQMDFCERLTLRDLVRRDLYKDTETIWRLFRQILDGLAHIHSHNIIHRDLKPDNIFIDEKSNPKIGDFGLATSAHNQPINSKNTGDYMAVNMTRSIGTTLYVAPELRSNVTTSYGSKVDMYSLGIILFEMCYPLMTAMERDYVIRALREEEHALPSDFNYRERANMGDMILALITHRPEERPDCDKLLNSGKIPSQIEDETIREALRSVSDSRSPYYHKMMSAIFSQPFNKDVKDSAWDLRTRSNRSQLDRNHLSLMSFVKERLGRVFRRHGAVETSRYILFPQSGHYEGCNVVRMLDASGTLVQLPYDLTLPNAKMVANAVPTIEKTFTIDRVFRESPGGGAPHSSLEADFDIVSSDDQYSILKEAEAIKALDEIIDAFPSLSNSQMCFHLNHSNLLECILDLCQIEFPKRSYVKNALSKLNINNWTWSKVRNELRAPGIGIPSTSLDELSKFDFRSILPKSYSRLREIFQNTIYLETLDLLFAYFDKLDNYMQLLGVHHTVYISPLSCVNEKFYRGGVLFQCIFDSTRRDILAAGGRYDKLVEENRPATQDNFTGCRAVGVSLGCDRLIASMAHFQKAQGKSSNPRRRADSMQQAWEAPRRCDILVASFDPDILRSIGVKMVADLWNYELSAELAIDTSSPEELMSHYRDDKHSWIIIIRYGSSNNNKPELKIRNMMRKEDSDVRLSDLITYLRGEVRDRDHRELPHGRAKLHRQSSTSSATEDDQHVRICVRGEQYRGKKVQKYMVVEAARSRARAVLDSYSNAPIVAVYVKDDMYESIRRSRLSDRESWRSFIRTAPSADRDYLYSIQIVLERHHNNWKENNEEMSRMVFIYNTRSEECFIYDLDL